ncbi:MlaD family protein [uncultured Roseibium sp.]|uniref:MCE family protein n=1 Tax=uncultured Roseibium sp. TaxID=1936171 RepID=UPI0032166EC0
METRANYILIGSFMMAVLLGSFLFVYWLAVTAESRENVFVRIIFPAPVTGLPIGGQVLFNGIPIGNVSALDFDPQNPKVVVATVRVKPNTPLRTDTTASLNFTGLTGVAYVDLNGGSLDAPLLIKRDSDEVPVMHAERSLFDDIVSGARDVLKEADSALSSIDGFLKENSPTVTKTLKNVEEFSSALAANSAGVSDFMANLSSVSKALTGLSGRMEKLVDQGERILAAVPSDDVTNIVQNVSSFSDSLANARQSIETIMAEAETAAKDLKTFTGGLNSSLEDVQKIVRAVDPEDIRKTVQGAAAIGELLEKRSPEIDSLIASTSSTMDNISEISGTIRDRKEAISEVIKSTNRVIGKVDTFVTRGNELAQAIDPDRVSNIVANVDTFSTGLNSTLGNVDQIVANIDPQKVGEAVDGAAAVVSNINAQKEQINEIIASTKSTIQNFEAFSATVRGEDDRIVGLVDDVRAAANAFTQTLTDADGILKAVDPDQVSTIVGSVANVTGGLSENKESIDAMIASARTAAANVEKMTNDLSQRTPDVDQIITDAKQMTATLNATSTRIQGIVDQVGTMVEGDGEGLIVEATKAATAIRKVAEAFESRADSIAGGLSKFANQGSADFVAAMSQVNRTLVSIQRAVESFDRNPNRILFGGEAVPTYTGGGHRR